MKICMLLESNFPPDIRVEKEIKALKKAGHQIYVISLNENGSKLIEDWNGVTIIRISLPRNILSRISRFARFNLFHENSFWGKEVEKIVNKYSIEVLHVHDLPLVKTALSISKRNHIPLIADLHENYPEALRVWRHTDMELTEKFLSTFSPIFLWKRTEKSVLKEVDEIIAVVEEGKDHYINECDISPNKITVVMNTEDIDVFNNIPIDSSIIAEYNDEFVISYIGGFGPHRGIDTAMKSISKVLNEIPNAKLLLVGGKGSKKHEKELNQIYKELNIRNHVEFTGWVDFSLVPSYIAISDICLVPHNASGHTNTTIPHKIFQYMAKGKPVIVTDCKPLKRIVEECNCGIVVPSGDYNKLAEAIIKLYKDKEYAKKLGDNGKKAVEEKYNWKNEAMKLCALYGDLEDERHRTVN